MVMPSNLSFNLSIKFDDRPLRNPHLRRFSLIFKADSGREELVIRGCLLPQDNKEILTPSVMVGGKHYSIAQLSPALQEAILNSFSFEDLYPVNRAQTATLKEDHATSTVREYLK